MFHEKVRITESASFDTIPECGMQPTSRNHQQTTVEIPGDVVFCVTVFAAII